MNNIEQWRLLVEISNLLQELEIKDDPNKTRLLSMRENVQLMLKHISKEQWDKFNRNASHASV